MTEGLGLFDGCGPGRGKRYDFGVTDALANVEPVGRSKLRVVAGMRAAIACCKEGCPWRCGRFLNNEDYPHTVHSDGDGKRAILRYLAGGGTLLLLASGPFPYFYADAPGGVHRPDPLLPQIGLPMISGGETAPAGLTFLRQPGQEILRNPPASFPFGQGDGRIRSVAREKIAASDHYVPLVKAIDAGGKDYGDVACWIEFKTGPAAGGRIRYVWSSLQAGPHGTTILADTLRWALRGLQPKLPPRRVATP